jgi:hypothetical protein
MTDVNTLVERLGGLLKRATPGPWMVQDGCSWRRIGTREHDGDVLCPTKHHRDGHPDLTARDGRRDDNLALIVEAVNALPDLLATLTRLQQRLEVLTRVAVTGDYLIQLHGRLQRREVVRDLAEAEGAYAAARAALTGETKA